MNASEMLPPITVGTDDYNRLMLMASLLDSQGAARAEPLLNELRRADVRHPDDLQDNVVAMNSRVIYRVNEEWTTRSRVLVYPDEYNDPANQISVLTSLGTALLGLRISHGASYREQDTGFENHVLVQDIGVHARRHVPGATWQLQEIARLTREPGNRQPRHRHLERA